jgi:hypothetical protein
MKQDESRRTHYRDISLWPDLDTFLPVVNMFDPKTISSCYLSMGCCMSVTRGKRDWADGEDDTSVDNTRQHRKRAAGRLSKGKKHEPRLRCASLSAKQGFLDHVCTQQASCREVPFGLHISNM